MTTTIRPAESADCEEITRVLFEAFREYQHLYTTQAFDETVIPPDRVNQRLQEGQLWVASIGGSIVGTAAGVNHTNEYYLRGMGVSPEARGQNIGVLLLKEIEAFARNSNYGSLVLTTTPYLKWAIRLYENHGFVIVNEPPFQFFGTPAFQMRKILG